MTQVRTKENESIDSVVRRFKRNSEKAGILRALRRKEFYEKPTKVRKRKKAAAVKRHQKKVAREESLWKNLRQAKARKARVKKESKEV